MSASTVVVRPEAIADELRDDVLEQRMPPGAAVTEAAVAQRFDVTRPTARLAIERLVAEGLLVREAHRSARVPVLTRDDIADLYATRDLVETAAIARLARAGTIPAAALDAHRALLAGASDERFARADADFHRALVAGQSSARLAKLHGALMGEIELCIGQVQAHHLLAASTVAEQHQGILDAVIAGDADLASRLASAHISGARDALLDHYDATRGA